MVVISLAVRPRTTFIVIIIAPARRSIHCRMYASGPTIIHLAGWVGHAAAAVPYPLLLCRRDREMGQLSSTCLRRRRALENSILTTPRHGDDDDDGRAEQQSDNASDRIDRAPHSDTLCLFEFVDQHTEHCWGE